VGAVSTSTEERTVPVFLTWMGRFVASFFILLGLLALGSVFETSSAILPGAASLLGVGGGLVYLLGLERPHHRMSQSVRIVGWLMMAGFSAIPTSLMFVPAIVVLLALPPLFLGSRRK
jgi:hypothetical protein